MRNNKALMLTHVSDGLAVPDNLQHLDLLSVRGEKRRLEEEVHRLRCQIDEMCGVAAANSASLAAIRLECAEMEELFLEQRRRNVELESSLRKAETTAIEVNALRKQVSEYKSLLLRKETEAFERDLSRSSEDRAAYDDAWADSVEQFRLARSCWAVEMAEAERRLSLILEASDSLAGLATRLCASTAQRVSFVGREARKSSAALEESETAVARLLETSKESELQVARVIGELKSNLARAEERSADALRAVQTERNVSATLRKELKEAKERITSLLTIQPPFVSDSYHGTVFDCIPPLRSEVARALRDTPLSPERERAAVNAELVALRRKVSELGQARETSLFEESVTKRKVEAEVEALRKRVSDQELELKLLRSVRDTSDQQSTSDRLREKEEAFLLAGADSSRRHQQLILLSKKVSAAEREASHFKELSAALQHRLQLAHDTVEDSRLASKEQDELIKGLRDCVETLTRERDLLTERICSVHNRSLSPPRAEIRTGDSSLRQLQQAKRRLELVIEEMSTVKAENVSLRAQVSAMSSTNPTSAMWPLLSSSERPREANARWSESREVSPQRSGKSALRHVDPSNDLLVAESRSTAAAAAAAASHASNGPSPSLKGGVSFITERSYAQSAVGGPLSPWREADARLASEIKALAGRNAYLEAVLSEQKRAASPSTTVLSAKKSTSVTMQTPRLPSDRPAKSQVAARPRDLSHSPTLPSSSTAALLQEPARPSVLASTGGARSPKSQSGVITKSSSPYHAEKGKGVADQRLTAARSLFFHASAATPRPAPALSSTQNSPSRRPSSRLSSAWTPDAPVATETARRRREQPGSGAAGERVAADVRQPVP